MLIITRKYCIKKYLKLLICFIILILPLKYIFSVG